MKESFCESRPEGLTLEAKETNRPERIHNLLRYISGPNHVHTNESESGIEAASSLREIVRYLENQVDKGSGAVQFLIATEHSEHLGKTRSDAWFQSHGFSAPEIEIIRNPGGEFKELPPEKQHLLNRVQRLVLEEQVAEVAKLNSESDRRIRIYTGTETSIMGSNGELTLPDDTLANLDVVIASIHPDYLRNPSGDKERIYEETPEGLINLYQKALDNKNIDVLGHPIKGNMKRIVEELQKRLVDNGSIETTLAPLLLKMTQNHVAFEINIKDPIVGLPVTDNSSEVSLFEEIVRLLAKYQTPISIGIDWHLLGHWQNKGRIYGSLSDDEIALIETAVSDRPKVAEKVQAAERIRQNFGVGEKFWLRILRIGRMLDKYNIPPEQVVNSSRNNLEHWIEERNS